MKESDFIFKMGLLVLGFMFVVVYFLSSQNGRYQHTQTETNVVVFDTRTGISYTIIGDHLLRTDFVNNKFTDEAIKTNTPPKSEVKSSDK